MDTEKENEEEETQGMSVEEELAAYAKLINPGSARFLYEISLKGRDGIDAYLLRVPFHTYAPLDIEHIQGLWELIKEYFTEGSIDRADAAQELVEAGETDYRLIADKTDTAFQWLSEEEQKEAIKTLRNTITARRAKRVRKRNNPRKNADKPTNEK